MMNTITLRLNDADAQLFKSYAEAHGMTLTDLIRISVLEKIEDEYDLAALREALENPNPVFYSMEEVKEELGF